MLRHFLPITALHRPFAPPAHCRTAITLKSIKNMAADANDGEIIDSDGGPSSANEARNRAQSDEEDHFSLDDNEFAPVDALRLDAPKDGPHTRTTYADEFECDFVDWQKKNRHVENALRGQVRAKLLSFTELMDALRNPLTPSRELLRRGLAEAPPANHARRRRDSSAPRFAAASAALRSQAAIRKKSLAAAEMYPALRRGRAALPLVRSAPGELGGETLAAAEKWLREKVLPRLRTGYGVYDERYLALKERRGLCDAVAARSYFFGDFRPAGRGADKARPGDPDAYVDGLFDAAAAARVAYNFAEARRSEWSGGHAGGAFTAAGAGETGQTGRGDRLSRGDQTGVGGDQTGVGGDGGGIGIKSGAGAGALGEVYRKDARLMAASVARVKEDPFLISATLEADPLRLGGALPRDLVVELEPVVRTVLPLEMPATSQQATFVAMMRAGCHYGAPSSKGNPWMYRYIFCERNKQHIFDLTKCLAALRKAMLVLQSIVKDKGRIWFVGNSPAASTCVEELADRCEEASLMMPVSQGMISNFNKHMERARGQRFLPLKSFSEKKLVAELRKVAPYRQIDTMPDIIVMLNIKGNESLVKDAKVNRIPVIGLCDSDTCPLDLTYVVPGNDDTPAAVRFVMEMLSLAVRDMKDEMRFRAQPERILSETHQTFDGVEDDVEKRLPNRHRRLQVEMLNPRMRSERLKKIENREAMRNPKKSALEDDVFKEAGIIHI